MTETAVPYSVNGDNMHITLPRLIASTDEVIEQLKAQLGILRIEKHSLLEQLEQRRLDYAATLSERDAYRAAYTAAQVQLCAISERNDELNAELAEAKAECAARCALLRRAISVSVIGMELRNEIGKAIE